MKVAVLGGGAAGLTSAIFAAQNGAKVIVIERMKEAGKKILMSGGTRCNVLPVTVEIAKDYFSSDPALMKNMFSSWNLPQCYNWLSAQVGLEMEKEEESNNQSSKEVRDKLVAKCLSLGVEFKYLWKVDNLRQLDNGWVCEGDHNGFRDEIEADKVVVSTGGLSFPLVGTDGTGHTMVSNLGIEMHPTYPALTPLRGPHPGTPFPEFRLQLDCTVLLTRKDYLLNAVGYSGPAVLDLSHHAVKALEFNSTKPKLEVNWADMTMKEWERELYAANGNELVVDCLSRHLPSRLATALCRDLGILRLSVSWLSEEQQKKLITSLVSYPLLYEGHDGYKKAEVTGGGVKLSEIHSHSCESKKFPGLFLCGEILDVFGRIGGFNFYWAWVSGRLAGMSTKGKVK